MKKLFYIISITLLLFATSCSENYSNGERIGLVTQFSQTGLIWKSWEGHLNLTQTGMNSSSAVPFDFSIDNDREPEGLASKIDSAARFGYKVKLIYHEVAGWNWFKNRGNTDHFVTSCEILDKNPVASAFSNVENKTEVNGKTVDTIYVVIVGHSKTK